ALEVIGSFNGWRNLEAFRRITGGMNDMNNAKRMREAVITPTISRLDGGTFNLYVKDHSSLIMRSDEWSAAELRAIAKDIEKAWQAEPATIVEPASHYSRGGLNAFFVMMTISHRISPTDAETVAAADGSAVGTQDDQGGSMDYFIKSQRSVYTTEPRG